MEENKAATPLVSVMIPTYCRPGLFKEALDSVLGQTYPNIEILVSDDSSDDATERMMQGYLEKHENIHYVRNPGLTARENFRWLFSNCNLKSKYLGWLIDDDFYMPEKIERMVALMERFDNVSLTTTGKQVIDIKGNNLGSARPLGDEAKVFPGEWAGRQLFFSDNYIGEPSCVLMRSSCVDRCLGWAGDEGDVLIGDVELWLQLLTKGDLGYIPDLLTAFRRHKDQGSADEDNSLSISIGYMLQLQYAWNRKIFLKTKEDAERACLIWLRTAADRMQAVHPHASRLRNYNLLLDLMRHTTNALSKQFRLDFDVKALYN